MSLDDTIPIELFVRGRRCVAVGACEAIEGKVSRLLRAGAVVELFAELGRVSPALQELVRRGDVALVERPCDPGDILGAAAVFVSPQEEGSGERLSHAAREAGVPLCTLDRPAACTFFNPASTDVGGLRISIASGGAAPALVKRIREDLQGIFSDARLARFVVQLSTLRTTLPADQRAAALRDRVEGFRVEGRLVFPGWVDEA